MKILLLETKKTGETKTLAGKSFPLRVEDAAAMQHLRESPHRDAVMPGLQASFA
jgi:hypothetical protein